MADMRQYAERLAKAMPERFEFIRTGEYQWVLYVVGEGIDCNIVRHYSCQWGFWGPLADEMKIEAISVGTFDGDCHFVGPTDLLEAIAEAVCQEAERRAEPTP